MNDQCCFHTVDIAILKDYHSRRGAGLVFRAFLLQRYWKPSTIFFACKSRAGTVDLSLVQILMRTRTYLQNRFFTGYKMSM
jgi:hypothetical protein